MVARKERELMGLTLRNLGKLFMSEQREGKLLIATVWLKGFVLVIDFSFSNFSTRKYHACLFTNRLSVRINSYSRPRKLSTTI